MTDTAKFAVKFPAQHESLIGPFETYDIAKVWAERSVFSHGPREIIGMIPPRLDHVRFPEPYVELRETINGLCIGIHVTAVKGILREMGAEKLLDVPEDRLPELKRRVVDYLWKQFPILARP
jgi:hypothetical protein